MDFTHIIETAGEFLDGAGVLVIVLGVLSSTVGAAVRWVRGDRRRRRVRTAESGTHR